MDAAMPASAIALGRASRLNTVAIVSILTAAIIAAIVFYPILMSFRVVDLTEFRGLFTEGSSAALSNSILLSALALPPSIVVGVSLAWLCTRSDLPCRRAIAALIGTSFVMPMLITSIAYVFLFGKNAGLINTAYHDLFGTHLYDIYSFSGIVLVAFLHSYPLIFFTTAAGLAKVGAELEEAGRVSGMSGIQVFRRITIPAVLPSMMAGATFATASNLNMLSGPIVLGLPANINFLATEVYSAIGVHPNFGRAFALSIPLVLATLFALWAQRRLVGQPDSPRFAVIGGKGARSAIIQLRRWRWIAFSASCVPITLSLVLPIGVLLGAAFMERWWKGLVLSNLSLRNFTYLFADATTWSSIANSIYLSIGSAFLLASAGVAVSIVTSGRRNLLKVALRWMSIFPIGIPHVVAGLLVLLAWYGWPFYLGGSPWLLVFGYGLVMLPYAVRTCSAALGQIDPALVESAQIVGCTPVASWRHVVLPLMRNGIFTSFVIVFLFIIKEFPLTVLLYSAHTQTLAVRIFSLFEGGSFERTAAASVLLLAITFGVLFLAGKLFDAKAIGAGAT